MPNRVFVLGAGFSKALSRHMPVTPELSRAVRDRLHDIDRPLSGVLDPFGDDLERWLSYLADRQPWIDEATNLRNRAAFADVSAAIAMVLKERQIASVWDDQPDWLDGLVAYWSRMGSSVITFNYDVLVEAAAVSHIGTKNGWSHLYRAPLVPAASRTGAALWGGPSPEGSF